MTITQKIQTQKLLPPTVKDSFINPSQILLDGNEPGVDKRIFYPKIGYAQINSNGTCGYYYAEKPCRVLKSLQQPLVTEQAFIDNLQHQVKSSTLFLPLGLHTPDRTHQHNLKHLENISNPKKHGLIGKSNRTRLN